MMSSKQLLLCLGAASGRHVRAPGAAPTCRGAGAARLRGGSSYSSGPPGRWPPTPAQDAWAKHREAARSLTPQKPKLRQESLDDVVDAKPLSELLDRDSRVVFVRRVYGLLTANLALTAGACLLLSANPHLVRNLLTSPGGGALLGLATLGGLGSSLAISFVPGLRQSLPLFLLFAASESLLVGVAASVYRVQSVALALAQTGAATGALTAWACHPNQKYDLTQFGGMLLAGLVVLMVSTLFGVFVPGIGRHSLLGSTLGALLFSAFIVHDTQLVVGGKKRQLATSDYVLGAMSLYMDVVNLFLYLLRLFGELQER